MRLLSAVGAHASFESLLEAARSGARLERGAARTAARADPELRVALEPIAEGRDERGGVLGALAAARAEELLLELEMIDAMETPALRPLGRRRYLRGDAFEARADEVARAWAGAPERDEGELRALDDPRDPRSLVSRLRAELSRRGVPFRVTVRPGLAALAATAPGEVQVAAGRRATDEAIARTVVHEVLGHAVPMHLAASEPHAVMAYASAQGGDEQEGYALVWEERSGHLEGRRRRELAWRHLGARAVQGGADLDEVVRGLLSLGAELEAALRVALRVSRGGGLARECVYLPAWLRVRASDPRLREVLGRGRVTVEAARALGEG